MTGNSTIEYIRDTYYFSYASHVLLCVLYVAVFMLNFFGNIMIWLTIPFKKSLRSPMNFLLLNLALTHLISGVAAVIFSFMTDIGKLSSDPHRQKIYCGLFEGLGLYFTSCGSNIFTLCVISLNRFLAITFPTRQRWRIQKSGAILLNILTWIMSLVIVAPSFISFKYDHALRLCVRDWGNIRETPYRLIGLIISTILPITFLTITFLAIVWKRHFDNLSTNNSGVARTRNSRLLRAEKILGIVILTFVVFWSPFCLYWGLYIVDYFVGIEGEFRAMRWLRVTILITAMNGVTDPYIYIFGSKDLRSACIRLLLIVKGKLTRNSMNRIHNVQHEAVNKTNSSSARNTLPNNSQQNENVQNQ